MLRYVIKRLLLTIPVIIAVAILIFTLMYFVPGDPASIILGSLATEAEKAALNEQLGLTDPYFVQLGRFLKTTFIDFDLGTSYISKASVGEEILMRIPYTFKLCYIGLAISIAFGLILGIFAAVNHNTWKDNVSMVISMLGVSMPNFWFALMMVMWFALGLGWFPVTGVKTWLGYVIPCVTIGIGGMSMLARQMRSSMLEAIRQDYIITAKAKGQTERKIITKHVIRNAMIPVITTIGGLLASSMGGSVVVEQIFSIPGLGSYLMDGIYNRDYPVVQGTVLFLAIVFTLMMLVTDILYAVIDPRLRSNFVKTKKAKVKE